MYPTIPIAPLSPAAQASAEAVIRIAQRLGADAGGHLFDTFGVVDVELAFALMRLVTTDYPVPEPIAAYAHAVWARPSVREFVDHQRPPNPPI